MKGASSCLGVRRLKSILITGGTGFFGRTFASRLLGRGDYDRICIYSRSESLQAAMRDEIGDDKRMRWFIGDVRDGERLRRAMSGVHVVVHAAALKRIEVGMYNPIEMCRTNIDGTINVVNAAHDSGSAETVVYLSTDKAYAPHSTYGQTKAIGESLVAAANNTMPTGGPKFISTRYGNVFNSTGSVLPRWKSMIAGGATSVPVTDPECTRFFMTADEAVELVLLAISEANVGRHGEVLIPELPAYRIGDLAEALGVEMDVRGLPSWEKLHEGMADGNTSDVARRMSVDELREAIEAVDDGTREPKQTVSRRYIEYGQSIRRR